MLVKLGGDLGRVSQQVMDILAGQPTGRTVAGAVLRPSAERFTPGSTCDGQGACVTPAASSCFPFQCGVNVCNASCTTDAECAAPAVCTNGSCGLKSPGAACGDGSECATGFCAQGVCCRTACTISWR